MAKGSQNGVLKGKRGNTVFFKIANSNNKEKQGSREYVAEVANPMTVPQATQRVKMTPAIRFYSAFKEDCLDHSFEGIKYGGQSMRHFMKMAFVLQTGWPFAQKGLSVALPGEYLMSQGSLTSIQYGFDDTQSFVCDVLSLIEGTMGQWAQSVIDASHGTIQNGDQITIITLQGENIDAPWPKTVRIVLDTDAKGNAETTLNEMGIYISPDGVIGSGSQNDLIFGGCVILSRPELSQTTGALTWKRSTQRMAVNYGLRQVASLFTQTAYNTAVRSFTKSGNRDIQSDYYLNQGKKNTANLNIPDAPTPSDLPVLVDVTYNYDGMGNQYVVWPSTDLSTEEGSDSWKLKVILSSDQPLNMDLAKIRRVDNDEDVTDYKVEVEEGIRLEMNFDTVSPQKKVAVYYNGVKVTSNMQIDYIVNP